MLQQKAVEVVSLIKALKEKDKRIAKSRKMGRKRRREENGMSTEKEGLMADMRTKKFCGRIILFLLRNIAGLTKGEHRLRYAQKKWHL